MKSRFNILSSMDAKLDSKLAKLENLSKTLCVLQSESKLSPPTAITRQPDPTRVINEAASELRLLSISNHLLKFLVFKLY